VREAAQNVVGVPLEQVSYAQLPSLLGAVERDAPLPPGGRPPLHSPRSLTGFTPTPGGPERRLTVRWVSGSAVSDRCQRLFKLKLNLETIDRDHLPQLAAAVRQDAALLLGPDVAAQLGQAVEDAAAARPVGLSKRVIEVATERAGTQGEQVIRELCHERLEIDLDDLNGRCSLLRAVERDGPAIRRLGAAGFVAAAKGKVARPTPVRNA
jgi:hypothetical protein